MSRSSGIPFKLQEVLNPESALALEPSPSIDFSTISAAPNDWQNRLEKFCCDYNKNLKNPLEKHIGANGSYTAKTELIEQLKIIYHRLSGDLDNQLGKLSDSERTSMLLKLTEDIAACTPGFHNRINTIITAMQLPSSLAQLLCKTRQSLVENTAATLTLTLDQAIHAANRVTLVAEQNGFGVTATSKSDIYTNTEIGTLPDKKILEALRDKFESDYTPFNIPILLCDELRGVLSNFGYIGRKDGAAEADKSYDLGDATAFAALIESCLNRHPEEPRRKDWFKQYFIVEQDNDGICEYIRDIDWPKINKLFFEALEKEKYFNKKPTPERLWEHAYYCSIEDTVTETKKLFASSKSPESKQDLVKQLKKMRSVCPAVYEKLTQDVKIMQQMCDLHFDDIRDLFMQAQKKGNYSELLNELKKLKLMFPQVYQELIKRQEIAELVSRVITALTPPVGIIARTKAIIKTPPSLETIAQAFQLIIDTSVPNSLELQNNLQKLEPFLKESRKHLGYLGEKLFSPYRHDLSKNVNAALVIAKTLHQYYGNFNNDALQTFLKEFIREEHDLVSALKKLPQNSWVSLIEIPNMPCSPSLRNAIRFTLERKIDPSRSMDFLTTYESLEKLGEHYANDFLKKILEYVENNTAAFDDPGFFLSILMLLKTGGENKELENKVIGMIPRITADSWGEFLKTAHDLDLTLFLSLAKTKEGVAARLALVKALPAIVITSGIEARFLTCDLERDRLRTWKDICDIANLSYDDNSIIQLNAELGKLLQSNEKFLFFSTGSGILSRLTIKPTAESSVIRHILFEKFLENPRELHYCFYFFPRRNVMLVINMSKSLFIQFRENDQTKLAVRVIEKLVSLSKLNQYPYDHLEKSLSILFPAMIQHFDVSNFKKLLEQLNSDSRKEICRIAYALPINNINALKIFIIAKLSIYMDSNKVDPTGKSYARLFDVTFSSTKRKLADAKKLIGEIENCTTITEIRSKIGESEFTNDKLDSTSVLPSRPYANCLEECRVRTRNYETTSNTTSSSAGRTATPR